MKFGYLADLTEACVFEERGFGNVCPRLEHFDFVGIRGFSPHLVHFVFGFDVCF